MGGSCFGRMFRATTFGESHGGAVGVVVDGCPAGLELSEADVQKELDRRRPGQAEVTTARAEEDRVEILSGVFEGRTLGTPIAMVVWNKDADPSKYEAIRNTPRPSHADFTYQEKFGRRDWRGGGRASGRETVGRVAAGAVAKRLLSTRGIEVLGHTVEVHGVRVERDRIDIDGIRRAWQDEVRCADPEAAGRMKEEILRFKKEGDSVGGIVEVVALGVPPGLGEPVFDKLDADLAGAVMSVGAVKGVEIGAGFGVAGRLGSENNDPFIIKDGEIRTATNNSGGIQGGISNGMPIVLRAAVKPTPSILKPQGSVDLERMEETEIRIEGRHDPCIVPRIVPVLEAMVALVLADHALRGGFIGPARL
ncbi:MAG: chorismate synthase [Euryarchaeota archaeon]|nr:chorismate synthase [Euryarchaeota archaeon]